MPLADQKLAREDDNFQSSKAIKAIMAFDNKCES